MSHEVSVDPVDDACIDISHLEQRWNLGVSDTAIDPNHLRHPPVAAVSVSGRIVFKAVLDNQPFEEGQRPELIVVWIEFLPRTFP